MRVVIQDDYQKMCKWAANYIAGKINAHKGDKPFVLGLPTGSSPLGVYAELIKKNKHNHGQKTYSALAINQFLEWFNHGFLQ